MKKKINKIENNINQLFKNGYCVVENALKKKGM